jgi:hypothetical protein
MPNSERLKGNWNENERDKTNLPTLPMTILLFEGEKKIMWENTAKLGGTEIKSLFDYFEFKI